jgi:hypothetical protein
MSVPGRLAISFVRSPDQEVSTGGSKKSGMAALSQLRLSPNPEVGTLDFSAPSDFRNTVDRSIVREIPVHLRRQIMRQSRLLIPMILLAMTTACGGSSDGSESTNDTNKSGSEASKPTNDANLSDPEKKALVGLVPTLTLDPESFSPGDTVKPHGEFLMGEYVAPVPCHDISRNEDSFTAPQRYVVRLLTVDAASKEHDPNPNNNSTVAWDSAAAKTWVKRDFPTLKIPSGAGQHVRFVLDHARDNAINEAGNCRIETDFLPHLVIKDYRLSCGKKDSASCRYITAN